jgi:hypothetical protein
LPNADERGENVSGRNNEAPTMNDITRTARILIVDDDQAVQVSLALLLTAMQGWCCCAFRSILPKNNFHTLRQNVPVENHTR